MTFNLHALRRERLIQFVTSAVLVDILFLPYLQAFIFPLSLPFVVAAIFFDRRFYISNTNLFLFSIVIGLVFLSVLMSVLLKSNDYLVEDLKRAFQFLTSFLLCVFLLCSNSCQDWCG